MKKELKDSDNYFKEVRKVGILNQELKASDSCLMISEKGRQLLPDEVGIKGQ